MGGRCLHFPYHIICPGIGPEDIIKLLIPFELICKRLKIPFPFIIRVGPYRIHSSDLTDLRGIGKQVLLRLCELMIIAAVQLLSHLIKIKFLSDKIILSVKLRLQDVQGAFSYLLIPGSSISRHLERIDQSVHIIYLFNGILPH